MRNASKKSSERGQRQSKICYVDAPKVQQRKLKEHDKEIVTNHLNTYMLK